jgi:hypothetical protein
VGDNTAQLWCDMGQVWSNIVKVGDNTAQLWCNMGQVWSNMVKVGDNTAQLWCNMGQVWSNNIKDEVMILPSVRYPNPNLQGVEVTNYFTLIPHQPQVIIITTCFLNVLMFSARIEIPRAGSLPDFPFLAVLYLSYFFWIYSDFTKTGSFHRSNVWNNIKSHNE